MLIILLKLIDGSVVNTNNILSKSLKEEKENFQIHDAIIDLLFKSKLPKNLHMIDRASMMHSVEFRSPFVDKNIVNHCIQFYKDDYINKQFTKIPLREAMTKICPEINWYHKKKNIQSPQNQWMFSGKGKIFFDDILNSKNKIDELYFQKKAVINYWNQFCQKKILTGFPIWQYINLYYLEKFVNEV